MILGTTNYCSDTMKPSVSTSASSPLSNSKSPNFIPITLISPSFIIMTRLQVYFLLAWGANLYLLFRLPGGQDSQRHLSQQGQPNLKSAILSPPKQVFSARRAKHSYFNVTSCVVLQLHVNASSHSRFTRPIHVRNYRNGALFNT